MTTCSLNSIAGSLVWCNHRTKATHTDYLVRPYIDNSQTVLTLDQAESRVQEMYSSRGLITATNLVFYSGTCLLAWRFIPLANNFVNKLFTDVVLPLALQQQVLWSGKTTSVGGIKYWHFNWTFDADSPAIASYSPFWTTRTTNRRASWPTECTRTARSRWTDTHMAARSWPTETCETGRRRSGSNTRGNES